jgi:hypothetical protein
LRYVAPKSKNIQYEKRPQDEAGGVLWSRWDEEHEHRTTTGLLYVDECSFLALVQVLTSGRSVILNLHGHEYYRNTARIKNVGWFTKGDPDVQEDMEWAIQEARGGGNG